MEQESSPPLPPIVIIESPYAGDIEKNVAYAWMCLKDSCIRGEAPFASHLLYTGGGHAGFAREAAGGTSDPKHWMSREEGLRRCESFRAAATKTVFYTDMGWSSGMIRAREAAERLGHPTEERKLPELEGDVSEDEEEAEMKAWSAKPDPEAMRRADEFAKLPWPDRKLWTKEEANRPIGVVTVYDVEAPAEEVIEFALPEKMCWGCHYGFYHGRKSGLNEKYDEIWKLYQSIRTSLSTECIAKLIADHFEREIYIKMKSDGQNCLFWSYEDVVRHLHHHMNDV